MPVDAWDASAWVGEGVLKQGQEFEMILAYRES